MVTLYDLEVTVHSGEGRPAGYSHLTAPEVLQIATGYLAAWGRRAPEGLRTLAPDTLPDLLGETGTYRCETAHYRITVTVWRGNP